MKHGHISGGDVQVSDMCRTWTHSGHVLDTLGHLGHAAVTDTDNKGHNQIQEFKVKVLQSILYIA